MAKTAAHSPNWGGSRPGAGQKLLNASSAKIRKLLIERVMASETQPVDVVLEIMKNKKEPANIRLAAVGLLYQHVLPKQRQVDVFTAGKRFRERFASGGNDSPR